MTTADFIGKCVEGYITRNRTVSSVSYDSDRNVIYSYGTHYPLLFKLGNSWYLNDRGYSNTTSKHIGWAARWADFRLSLADAGGSYSYRAVEPTAQNALASVEVELKELRDRLAKFTPRAVKSKQQVIDRIGELMRSGFQIRETLGLKN